MAGAIDRDYPCTREGCPGRLVYESVAPNNGTGCLVILVGILFTPLLIGIPVFFYGLKLMGERQDNWRCTGCGLSLPVVWKDE